MPLFFSSISSITLSQHIQTVQHVSEAAGLCLSVGSLKHPPRKGREGPPVVSLSLLGEESEEGVGGEAPFCCCPATICLCPLGPAESSSMVGWEGHLSHPSNSAAVYPLVHPPSPQAHLPPKQQQVLQLRG